MHDARFDIGRFPEMHVRWRKDQPALIDGELTRTYGELTARIHRLAHALAARGVGFGDRVALLSQNRCEAVELILAAARLGAMAVPLNYRLAAAELTFMLKDSGSRMLVFDPTFAGLMAQLGELPALETRVSIGPEFEALLAEGASERAPTPSAPITQDTPHLLMYTAGTTGLPKGVVLTHGNTFWQVMNAVNLGMLPGSVGLAILPLFHVGGLNGSVIPLLFIGGTTVIQRQFDPGETIRLIERHRVQGTVGVPAIFRAMSVHPHFAEADLSSVIALTSGGAPLPLHLIRVYEARGVVFRQGYGLTEAAPGVTGMEPADAYAKPGSVGRPCHHTEVQIRREDGSEASPGERGEVVVRGPNVMPGYWNRPVETAETLRDGWLHTGDAGSLDEDGYLWVYGRMKRMIISGGENIYPAEIVNALSEHPGVADCAVVGAPDEQWGQVPVAFVVPWPTIPVTAELLDEFLKDRLARFKRPRAYRFVTSLPRSAAGKVLEAELEKQL